MFTGKLIPHHLRIICRLAKIYSMECGMIYRRVTEVTEVDQPTIPGLPNYWSQRPSFGRSGFKNQSPKMGPFLKRKRSMESWEDLSLSEEVRSFKRVRILSNIKKPRRAAFVSWEHKASWSVTESDQVDTVAGDDRFGSKSTSTSKVDATFRNLLPESIILSGATFFPSDEDKQTGGRVPAHALDFDSEEDNTSCPKEDALDSAKPADCFTEYPFGNRTLMEADISWPRDDEDPWEISSMFGYSSPSEFSFNIDDQVWQDSVAAPRIALLEITAGNDENCVRPGFLFEQYPRKLSARRAQLLEFLPGGPILAPISEPNSLILDIGPLNVWPVMGKLIASGQVNLSCYCTGFQGFGFPTQCPI